MKRPRLLTITQLFPLEDESYAGTFVVTLLERLRERFDVAVLVPSFPRLSRYFLTPRVKHLYHRGLDVYAVKFTPSGTLLERLRRRLARSPSREAALLSTKETFAGQFVTLAKTLHRERPFSIVHGHETYIGDEAARIGRELRRPSVITLHGIQEHHERLWGSAVMRRILENLSRATALTAVSRLAGASYHRLLPEPKPPLTIIPNVLPNRRSSSLPTRWKTRLQGRKIILGVGTYSPEKRFEQLIRATEQLKRRARGGSFATVLIGRGLRSSPLPRLVRARHLEEDVLFVGSVPPASLSAWYEAATCLAHPSVVESFSMVSLEAMGHGTPVVVTSAIGLSEYLTPNEDALVIPPDDLAALTDSLDRLLSDEGFAAALGERGARRAESFSWEHIRPAWESFYDTLTNVAT